MDVADQLGELLLARLVDVGQRFVEDENLRAPARARAMERRCCCPPERSPIGLWATSARPTRSSRLSAYARSSVE